MSHASVARKVRLDKERNPLKYCTHSRCLHTRPCPKHSQVGQWQDTDRYDHSRTCDCGAPWDRDLQMFACQD